MTKLLDAIYEHGSLRLLEPFQLPEHQKVTVAITVNEDEIPGAFIGKLAEGSQSFKFLNNPKEDIYSPCDGEKV